MPKAWRFSPFDEAQVRSLAGRLNISPVLSQILCARGMAAPERAAPFLDAKLSELHDPERLPGVSAAADKIVAAIRDDRRITIYGDYDVDGVTATSILWHCLLLAGAKVEYYVPHRLEEGYGLNCDALATLHERDPAMLVVSVDCGIASVREAAFARELGLQLIITDHHQQGPELPQADVLVHPRLPGGDYPFGDLCGAGVAFKLAWAICTRLGDGKKASPRMREFLLSAVGLAAIGTVADVVPLLDENRVLVRYGLKSLCERSP
ncbi:MAG TPA: DHH family phosphoesterase, partial [Planctomycetaceae bacterium]